MSHSGIPFYFIPVLAKLLCTNLTVLNASDLAAEVLQHSFSWVWKQMKGIVKKREKKIPLTVKVFEFQFPFQKISIQGPGKSPCLSFLTGTGWSSPRTAVRQLGRHLKGCK